MSDSTPPTSHLDSELGEKIRDLCQLGYDCYDREDFKQAVRQFFSAWTLLPKPRQQWREAGWVLTALGDAYFAMAKFDSAVEALRSALHCPDTDANPFIHLRLGQCLLEQGEMEAASSALERAWELGGDKVFEREDSKYFEVLNTAKTD